MLTLDVVTEDFTMALGSTLSESLSQSTKSGINGAAASQPCTQFERSPFHLCRVQTLFSSRGWIAKLILTVKCGGERRLRGSGQQMVGRELL
jgi:hypothetical protein